MRRIDADRLTEALEKNFGNTGGAAILVQIIKDAPTVKTELQTQGLWKGQTKSTCIGCDEFNEPKMADRRFYRCSKCTNGTVIKSNYCPKCGAKMDIN